MTEIFFNRGHNELSAGVTPKVPGPYLYGMSDNPTVFKRDDGLYSRQEIDDAFLAKIDQTMTITPESLTMQDWLLWLQHAWKAEHGTAEAAKRFGAKLVEEYDELSKALRTHLFSPTELTREEAISEAGDVLWCLGAAVTNAGVSFETILQTRLLKTAMGTLVIDEPQSRYPVWREKALEVATSTLTPMNIGDMDELFDVGYEPHASTAMNIETDFNDPEEKYEALDQWQLDQLLSVIFKNNLEQQFGGEPGDEEHLEQLYGVGMSDATRYKEAIEEIAPYIILRTMYTIRVMTSATLSEVIAKNYKKISARIDAGRIDHADGERSDDLL